MLHLRDLLQEQLGNRSIPAPYLESAQNLEATMVDVAAKGKWSLAEFEQIKQTQATILAQLIRGQITREEAKETIRQSTFFWIIDQEHLVEVLRDFHLVKPMVLENIKRYHYEARKKEIFHALKLWYAEEERAWWVASQCVGEVEDSSAPLFIPL